MTGRDLTEQEEPAVKGMEEAAPGRGDSWSTGPPVGTGGKEAEEVMSQLGRRRKQSSLRQETWVSFYCIFMKSR